MVLSNRTDGQGGGIHARNHSQVTGNTIDGNSAVTGGGIYGQNVTVSGNLLQGNSATKGGGIALYYDGVLTANVVISNMVASGGQGSGVYLDPNYNAPVIMNKNVVIDNHVMGVPSVPVGGISVDGREADQTTLQLNSVYGNLPYDLVVLSKYDIAGTNNFWGTSANVDILSHVYDWYDDPSRGRLVYVPYLQNPDPNSPVPPPLNLSGTFNDSSAVLTWDAIPSTTTGYRYKIYYDNDQSDPPYQGTGLAQGNSPIDVGNLTSYTLTGLAGGKYYFVVTGYDNQGHESWYSNLVVRLNKAYLPLIRR